MIIEKQETSPGYLIGEICKGGAGSGNFGHSGRPGEVGGSDAVSGSGNSETFNVPESLSATASKAKLLNDEWTKNFPKEPEGPFWNVEGEKNGRYWEVRNTNGKLVAGATTVQKGLSTDILSIGSHSKGQGKIILDRLKKGNIFLIALASSEKSKKWFLENGFHEVRDKPGQYNVRWKRS